uniref:Uncharacterized protein n=1 Tax=Caulobacter sp. (strain K31) TaxID=366602 RepID=B0T0V6_CAUSK
MLFLLWITENFIGLAGLIGTVVTAVATFFLWRVTKVLAIETKRMADANSRPQIVATLEPNQWSLRHADLVIANTGNATAFDIGIQFDPPIANGEARGDEMPIPLQNISVLKPGQSISSYLSEFGPLLEISFSVSIEWLTDPSSKERGKITYTLDMRPIASITQLGTINPLVQIAEQVKKMREDWKPVASGSRKLKADVYTTADRLHERRAMDRRRRQSRGAQAVPRQSIAPPGDEPL